MNSPVAPLPDISQCDVEPIHIPGAIQPHGVLLALRGPALRILQVTASCEDLLGRPASDLLDRDLASALGADLAEAVRGGLRQYRSLPHAPFPLGRWPLDKGVFVGHVHAADDLAILELEPAPADSSNPAALCELLAQAVLGISAVHAEPELEPKLGIATALFHRLTGYDRVMIYRFNEDWHGEVVAETRRADLEPYLGLHYPASDIPAQARRLYLINPTRVIVDVDYVPSPLLPALNPLTGQPLDLSRGLLRSVSPVHLEYLRNMGVRATLTASLLREGRLWGLIACHHYRPRPVSGEVRLIADWMGQDLSAQIGLAEELARRRYETHLRHCRDHIISAMRHEARLAELVGGPSLIHVLGAIGAEGVALVSGTEIVTGGAAPTPERIAEILAGLAAGPLDDPSQLFATDCLGEQLPGTEDLAATAAGVVLFPLDAAQSIKLIWFRGEQLREVTWGGDPNKALERAGDGRLTPRHSFAAWTQIVRLHSKPWRHEELDSVRKLGALMDIEWRKQAEDAVRAQKALLHDVLDSLTAHIVVLDQRGLITMANAAWRRFAQENGGNARCQPGVNYLEVCRRAISYHQDPGQAQAALWGIQQVLDRRQDGFTLQYPCDSPTEQRWFEMRVLPLSNDRPGVLVTHEDITARKSIEAALQDANRRKDEFLATLAHELRNPLAPIRNAVDILKLVGPSEPVSQRARDMIERQVHHLVHLIDDLLDISRISLGKLQLRRERVELVALLLQAAETARPQIEGSGHQLTLSMPPLPILLDADPVRLNQVVLNLLDNARKYTEPGGRISLGAERIGDEAVVRFTDTGIGILPEQLPQVFETFAQLGTSGERTQTGLGIGLALVRRLVELHGGRIEAHSKGLGQGSRFDLYLPVLAETAFPPPTSLRAAQVPLGGPRRILVVDDNPDNAESLALLLRLHGHHVSRAQDGLEAVAVAERERPEIILMDLGMPRLDGCGACRHIRATPWGQDIRIIALTGWGQVEDRLKTQAAGFDGHLAKPVQLSDLLPLLER